MARAIDRELKRTGDRCVTLTSPSRARSFYRSGFPISMRTVSRGGSISRTSRSRWCRRALSLRRHSVRPERAHVDTQPVRVGEASCTGVHGANRLASNSLLEGLVFSHRAYLYLRDYLAGEGSKISIPEFPKWNKEGTFDLEEWILIQHNIEDVKRLMWDYVGIVRSNLRLQRAYRRILLDEEIKDYYKRSTISSPMVEFATSPRWRSLSYTVRWPARKAGACITTRDYPEPVEAQRKNVVPHTGGDPEMRSIEGIVFQ